MIQIARLNTVRIKHNVLGNACFFQITKTSSNKNYFGRL